MAKSAQEYFDLVDEIESKMAFDMDYFATASKRQKDFMQKEMNKIAARLIEKAEDSKIPKERKTELIGTIRSKLGSSANS